jgi:hypothetical protein
MNTETHILFEELADNLTDVFNCVREERQTVVVEYATGEKLLIKLLPSAKTPARRLRKKTKADYEAFRSSAGSWRDEDVDTFIKNVYESRRSSRPPVDL